VVTIEPRSLAVPYGHVARLHCSVSSADDDVISTWEWLVNGKPADDNNSSRQ